MHEWIPIVLSFCFGALWRFPSRGPVGVALAATGIVLISSTAFVLSGEFNISWTYFFLDILQASLGFFAGIAMLRAIRPSQGLRNAK